jgi:hypothetical protein
VALAGHMFLTLLDLYIGYLLQAWDVAASLELRGEKGVDDLVRETRGHYAGPHGQDVRVVVLPREPGSEKVVAEGGPRSVDLVCGHGLTLPAAAQDDPPLCLSPHHRAGHRGAVFRIVDRLFRVRPKILDLMALIRQILHKRLLQAEPGVIRTDGNFHGRYSRTFSTPAVEAS